MAERRGLTPEERLAGLRRDRARLRRERMLRELAGSAWSRMVRVVPIALRLEGRLEVRALRADREAVVDALRGDAVLALDTAMRLRRGRGLLAGGDVHVYLESDEPLERLAASGLIDAVPYADTTLVRPWPGPPRLFACITPELPEHERLLHGERVVTSERLAAELIGAVGRRADLFALLEPRE